MPAAVQYGFAISGYSVSVFDADAREFPTTSGFIKRDVAVTRGDLISASCSRRPTSHAPAFGAAHPMAHQPRDPQGSHDDEHRRRERDQREGVILLGCE